MFFQYDHITATLIAGIIVLMIIATQIRVQDAGIEQTAMLNAKGHALDLGDWLQQDLGNAGAGVPINAPFIEDYEVDAVTENTKRFSFWRKLQPTDPAPSLVTYDLIEGDSVFVEGQAVPLYQVQRCIGTATCPAGSPNIDGLSPSRLTYFRIDLLDENGGAWTAGTSSAYYLRVRFSVASTIRAKAHHLREAHWGTVLPLRGNDT